MKKSTLVVAVVLFLMALDPRSAAGQVTFVPGVKGGLSISKFNESWSTLKKPTLGAFLSINFNKIISIQPEVYWLTHGGSFFVGSYFDEMGNLIEIDYRWSLSYVHIPVLGKLYPIPKGTFRPVLFAGPAFDILLRAVQEDLYNGQRGSQVDIKGMFRGTNWDMVAGLGLEVVLDKVMLVVEARYTFGLTNINRLSPDNPLKTKALMFLAGFGF